MEYAQIFLHSLCRDINRYRVELEARCDVRKGRFRRHVLLLRIVRFADVVVFDEDRVDGASTYDQPHQFLVGIDHLIVNGKW